MGRALLGLLLLLLPVISGRSVVLALEFPYHGNPLVSYVSSADPDAHVWDDTVWVYTSTDSNLRQHGYKEGDPWTYAYMDGYHVFSTKDMIHWEDHGEVFHSRNATWGDEGWMWAPGAARKNGTYYLYYPHKDFEGTWRIGVATASSPVGPFQDIGKPLDLATGIDPMVFIDDDGQAYIYYTDHQVAKLKENMIELAEPPRYVDYGPAWVQDDEKLRFEEGPYMHKYNGKYIYSYSHWQADGDTAYYGIGESPYGPFEWQGGLAPATQGAPDHHSIIQFRGQWWYFYHMDTPWQEKETLNWRGHRRLLCFDKLYHNSNATIQKIERTYGDPTSIGINAGSYSYVASDGTLYSFDRYHLDTGRTDSTDAIISGTIDDFLYQSNRFDAWLEYQIPVENGSYRVTLKFAEIYHDSPGKRRFNVNIEDAAVISDLDLFALVGRYTAHDEVFDVNVNDGSLNISFDAIVDMAQVSAILVQKLDAVDNVVDLAADVVQGDSLNQNVTEESDNSYQKPPLWAISVAPLLLVLIFWSRRRRKTVPYTKDATILPVDSADGSDEASKISLTCNSLPTPVSKSSEERHSLISI